MDVRSVAMLVGATLTIAAGGASAAACGGGKIAGTGSGSSSGNSTVSSGGVSSGGTTSSSGGFSSSSSSGGFGSSSGSGGDNDGGFDTDSGTSSGGGPDCGSTPSLHVNPPGDVYCGYGIEGGPLECLGDDGGAGFCCLGGSLGGGIYAPQICASNSAGCMIATEGTGAIPIQCNQISDCPGNGAPGATACCLIGATVPAMPAGCDYLKSTHGAAIQCEGASGDGGSAAATSCAAGEINICSVDADCPSGMTCQPGKWKIYQIGFCQ